MDAKRDENRSDIQEFFADTCVLVTGGTGFLGNILLDKLIRCCPDLKMIYVLIRNKKGVDSMERFKSIFDDVVFERMKQECPNYLDKLTAITGDCCEPYLGLSDTDKDVITNNVNVVFHVAATVRFDEHLRKAVDINIRATRDLVNIAKNMKHLKAFVYISTAYSNCAQRKSVDEIFYDAPVSAQGLIKMVEYLNDDTLERITPALVRPWPNTYAYTKAVAENVVREDGKGLPLIVIRPSIVIATAKEPVAGWINNHYGPTGVVAGAGLGLLRTIHANGEYICDLVPCDYVVCAAIAAAWNIGVTSQLSTVVTDQQQSGRDSLLLKKDEQSQIPILNYVSSNMKPLRWKEFMTYNEASEPDVPSLLAIWVYSLRINKHKSIHQIYCFLLHLIPAFIIDTFSRITGKEPRLWKAYEKIHKFSEVISYFSTKEWKFNDDNVRTLLSKMTDKDKILFDFDLTKLNWENYCYHHVRGIRVYLVKDLMDTVPKAQEKRKRFMVAHYAIIISLWCMFLFFIFKLVEIIA